MERIRSLFGRPLSALLFLAAGLFLLSGCASPSGRRVGPTPMQVAETPYPEEERLSVGISTFREGNTSSSAMEKQSTREEIRLAETKFIPFHLKHTLDESGFWGEVRVVPLESGGMDLRVRGTVVASNGEELALSVVAEDSQGYVWIDRVYRDRLREGDYEDVEQGKRDPFQNMYNAIANDLATVRRRLDSLQVRRLRRTTDLLFAAEMLPERFGDHVEETSSGRLVPVRLPAEDDPMWVRVGQIARRNRGFYQALTETHAPFYEQMWEPYTEWRRLNVVENAALRDARSDSIRQTVAGALMIATAIFLETRDERGSSTVRDILILGGTQVMINGVNISQRTEFHREVLSELADSFSADARSVRVELEGQTVELTGSVQEQMEQWRDFLRRLEELENGDQTPE